MKIIILIVGFLIINTFSLYSQDNSDLKIKEMYDNLYPKEEVRNALSGNYLDIGFVQTLTEGWGTLVASYVNMYKATNDKAYLIKAINASLVIEYNRQDIQYPNDPSNKCWTYMGMTNPDNPSESQTRIIHKNGRALWGLSEFIYIVKHDNTLYNTIIPLNLIINPFTMVHFTTYGEFAEWLQVKVIETIDFINNNYWSDADIDWGNDVGFLDYNKKSMCINMQATYGAALTLIGILLADIGNQVKAQSYLDKAVKIANLFKGYPLKVYDYGGICPSNISGCDDVVYPLMDNDYNSYYWFDAGWQASKYHPVECWLGTEKRIYCNDLYSDMEDITHAVYTLTLPLTLTDYYSQYSPIDWMQMVKYRNTFTNHVYDGSNSFWSSVQGNNNVNIPNTYGSSSLQECTKYSSFGWMPLYKYDDLAGTTPKVYDILMDFYRGTLNNINDLSSPECVQFFLYPLHVNYYGLSEVVKAQWDKDCPSLTLRNRDVVYDQDFFSKKDIIVDPSLTNSFDPVNPSNSFADPVIASHEFIIEQNVKCNMVSNNTIVLKQGFKAKTGSYFHAYIDPNLCSSGIGSRISYFINDTFQKKSKAIYEAYSTHKDSLKFLEIKNIKGNRDTNYFYLGPNPNNGNMAFIYEIPPNETVILKIYDITGRQVFTTTLKGGKNTLPINASKLEAGVYFYRATAGNKVLRGDKIVIIK